MIKSLKKFYPLRIIIKRTHHHHALYKEQAHPEIRFVLYLRNKLRGFILLGPYRLQQLCDKKYHQGWQVGYQEGKIRWYADEKLPKKYNLLQSILKSTEQERDYLKKRHDEMVKEKLSREEGKWRT